MRKMKWTKAALALGPLVLVAACGGGGDGSSTSTTPQTTVNSPATTTAAISDVPLAGEVVADCSTNGVGLVDTVISAVNAIGGSSLPVALPKLSDIVAMADLNDLPVLGGIIVNAQSQLETISADDVKALIPGGVPGLAGVDVPAQLPAVCSNLVSHLPAGATTNPALLLAALGDPTGALGVIPVLDASQNPVGVLLATVPAGLIPGSAPGVTLPGVSTLPDLTSLSPLDPTSVPAVGGTLSTLTTTLLGLLDTHGLLSGNLLGLLLDLLP